MKAFSSLLITIICCTACSTTAKKEKGERLSCIQIEDRNGLKETIHNKERVYKYEDMDFLSSQPYEKVLRVFEKDEHGKAKSILTKYHPNGQISELLEAQEMRAHGAYQAWHSNGRQKIEAFVIGGPADLSPTAQGEWLFEGISKVWDDRGNLKALLAYQKGKLQGKTTYYFPNGQIKQTLIYDKDILEGEVKSYKENGKLWIQETYHNDLLEGPSIAYWNEETPSWIEFYQAGKLNTAQYFDVNGEQCSEIQNGSGWKTVFSSDESFESFQFHDGIPEGKMEAYSEDGDLQSFYFLRNGKKQGTEIQYYSFREVGAYEKPKISINWDSNLIHGMAKTWYPNGKVESQREFAKNLRNGMSFAWYSNGSLMYAEEYERDLLKKGTYYHHGQVVSKVIDGTGTVTIYDSEENFIRKISYQEGKPLLAP